jgi:hypothetical protein
MQQNLTVALDPRLHTTPNDLEARLALDLQIHSDLDALDKKINEAIALRDELQKPVASKNATAAQVAAAVNVLSRDIDGVAAMQMKASEGSLLFETKLRDHLAYLAADIDLSYDKPTAAHYAVFKELDQQAKQAEQKLTADVAEAEKAAGAAR